MTKNVSKSVIKNIKLAGIYSILIDETQVLARLGQVSFIIRYVVSNFSSCEHFIWLLEQPELMVSLINLIKVILNNYNLRTNDLRGQR